MLDVHISECVHMCEFECVCVCVLMHVLEGVLSTQMYKMACVTEYFGLHLRGN